MKRLLSLGCLLLGLPLLADDPKGPTYWVYFGTYTNGKNSKGIYRSEFNSTTGELSQPVLAAEVSNPSFLAIHPKATHLFAVGEGAGPKGSKGGGVYSFTLNTKTGELKAINAEDSIGSGPCHLTTDGKYVLVANYGGGSTTVIPIGEGGKLNPSSCFIQHKGSSINKSRQAGPHAHSVNLDRTGKYAYVADLGLDKILIYKYDADKGTIIPNDPPYVEVKGGAGPRHLAFHPTRDLAFACGEMDSTLIAFKHDPKDGSLKIINTQSTLPDGKPVPGNSTAEVVVHPNGQFVYVSNRGHNSIASFSIDEKTGEVKHLGNQGEGVKVPRNFNIDPTGKWMIVANQTGNDAIVYKIDTQTGQLTPTKYRVEVGAPVCVKFVEKK